MNTADAIRSIPAFKQARADSVESLISFAVLRRIKKGSYLFFDKDEISSIYFLVEGSAALYKVSGDNEKKVIFVCGGGSILNEESLDGKPASVNCEIISDSYIVSLEMQMLLNVCRTDFELTLAIMNVMSLKIRRLYRQMKNTVTSVYGDRRIAAKLWKLSKDYGIQCEDGIKIDFDLTITQLAELLGSKRETVSRQLRLLSDRGLVVINKGSFTIPDRDKLKKYFYEP